MDQKLAQDALAGVVARTAEKNGAYAERNQCVALIVKMALALGWRSGVREHEDKPGETWEPDWRSLVCIDLPTGQVTWHFHDSEKHLLAGLPRYVGSWDGHDTPEKYRRVNAALSSPAVTAEGKKLGEEGAILDALSDSDLVGLRAEMLGCEGNDTGRETQRWARRVRAAIEKLQRRRSAHPKTPEGA